MLRTSSCSTMTPSPRGVPQLLLSLPSRLPSWFGCPGGGRFCCCATTGLGCMCCLSRIETYVGMGVIGLSGVVFDWELRRMIAFSSREGSVNVCEFDMKMRCWIQTNAGAPPREGSSPTETVCGDVSCGVGSDDCRGEAVHRDGAHRAASGGARVGPSMLGDTIGGSIEIAAEVC